MKRKIINGKAFFAYERTFSKSGAEKQARGYREDYKLVRVFKEHEGYRVYVNLASSKSGLNGVKRRRATHHKLVKRRR